MKRINMEGMTINEVKVISYSHTNHDKKACYNCVCYCGTPFVTSGKSLRNGSTKSCGCLAKQTIASINKTHGHCSNGKSKLYHVWRAIKERCHNPNHKNYSRYGGRGITMCDEWKNDFTAFLRDVGDNPNGLTIDRIDNNKGYVPENIRWVDMKSQNNNKSSNVIIKHNGESGNAEYWANKHGIKTACVYTRRYRGWTDEEIANNRRSHSF